MDTGETLKKIGTLGGAIHVRKDMKRYYFGENEPGGPMSKEKLFGVHGPLLYGMPNPSSKKEEVTLEATVSDTKQDLIKELMYQNGQSRQEAESVVNSMIASGKLAEVNVEGLGKVLVWGGKPK